MDDTDLDFDSGDDDENKKPASRNSKRPKGPATKKAERGRVQIDAKPKRQLDDLDFDYDSEDDESHMPAPRKSKGSKGKVALKGRRVK
jgi:hypothetical protein